MWEKLTPYPTNIQFQSFFYFHIMWWKLIFHFIYSFLWYFSNSLVEEISELRKKEEENGESFFLICLSQSLCDDKFFNFFLTKNNFSFWILYKSPFNFKIYCYHLKFSNCNYFGFFSQDVVRFEGTRFLISSPLASLLKIIFKLLLRSFFKKPLQLRKNLYQ